MVYLRKGINMDVRLILGYVGLGVISVVAIVTFVLSVYTAYKNWKRVVYFLKQLLENLYILLVFLIVGFLVMSILYGIGRLVSYFFGIPM